MIKACIFDLDGVIVDTAHYHYLAWKRLANELGTDLTLDDNERLKGVSRIQSLNIILELGGISISEKEKDELAIKKNGWFVEYVDEMKPQEIFPGVKDLIASLRKAGYKIALASSSKNARRVIQLLSIEELFDCIVDGTMIHHSKPHPEIFLLAAKLLQIPPDQCLVFEDAEAGVEAAVAAGMRCVGIGNEQQLRKANLILKNTGDFTTTLFQRL